MTKPVPRDAIAIRLLPWAEAHGRHDLPWQCDPTPYRVWVSEVMLQQTQVTTVLPYFERFMELFPNIVTLAAATQDEVLFTWTGLGYYARARNLHRAARYVMQEYGGCLPREIRALQSLPGIGRSTAGAILALSNGQRHAILDGNARRVLARVFGVEGDPSAAGTLKRLWELAEECTPHNRIAQYTQGIMDLGARVCRQTAPRCDNCPLRDICTAFMSNRQVELPGRRRRRPRPIRSATALVIRNSEGALLLQKREEHGIWGGLWSLPEFDSGPTAHTWLRRHFPGVPRTAPMGSQFHSFTHYELELKLSLVDVKSSRPIPGCLWYDGTNDWRIGITQAVTRIANKSLCNVP